MNKLPCTNDLRISTATEPEMADVAWDRGTTSQEPNRNASRPQLNRTPRILVVEDDVVFRELNTEVLTKAGYAVEAVEDGAAAWETLNAHHYDLMVTDNSMPNVSGVELLRRLHARHVAMPVIMATGAVPADDLRHQPAVQPIAILIKPYAIAELVRAVRKVLDERKALHADSLSAPSENQTRTE